MVKVLKGTATAAFTKDSGKTIFSMDLENGLTPMVHLQHHFTVSVESMEKEFSQDRMEPLTTVFTTTIWKTYWREVLPDAGTALG